MEDPPPHQEPEVILEPVAQALALPNELLYLIFAYLDSKTLFSLSKVNRHLHYTALPWFFDHYQIWDLRWGWLDLWSYPRETFPALTSALFELPIKEFSVSIPKDLDQVLSDLRGLKALIHRVSECTELDLSFSGLHHRTLRDLRKLGRPPGISTNVEAYDKKINIEDWREVILGVLEEALTKGCSKLKVSSGKSLPEIYADANGKWISDLDAIERLGMASARSLVSEAKQSQQLGPLRKWGFVPNFVMKVLNLRESYAEPKDPAIVTDPPYTLHRPWKPLAPIPTCKLQTFAMNESLLLRPPFRSWTIHLLNTSAHLSVVQFTDPTVATTQWKSILPSLTLSHLEHLVLRDVAISYVDLSSFLERHGEKLKRLELLLPEILGTHKIRMSGSEKRFYEPMKVLEEFSLSPGYFIWLLNQCRVPESKVEGRSRNEASDDIKKLRSWVSGFLRLQTVSVVLDGSICATPEKMNDALRRIIILHSWFESARLPCPSITVSFFCTRKASLIAFLEKQTTSPTLNFKTLTNIQTLHFSQHYWSWTDSPGNLMDPIQKFAKKFPELKCIEFSGLRVPDSKELLKRYPALFVKTERDPARTLFVPELTIPMRATSV
ncbi:hypothetical protein BDN72DRAFT_59567 [Pluteus cervinus]|uniref:Uncharacterized protein n=1 Tax=Pluteus cervinus TaxID=181527 RepID=A0ACD3ATA8_9AGAR|nr:hypothetical protein BDN72DRAFT_59567 [Pluteus cervinus]